MLPGLDTKYFSLPRFAITDPKRSEIREAKRLVCGKNRVKSFHYRRQCRNIFQIEQFLIEKGAGARQYNICTVIAYRLGMQDMRVNISAFNYKSYYITFPSPFHVSIHVNCLIIFPLPTYFSLKCWLVSI